VLQVQHNRQRHLPQPLHICPCITSVRHHGQKPLSTTSHPTCALHYTLPLQTGSTLIHTPHSCGRHCVHLKMLCHVFIPDSQSHQGSHRMLQKSYVHSMLCGMCAGGGRDTCRHPVRLVRLHRQKHWTNLHNAVCLDTAPMQNTALPS
jgi:hypothetical protein